MIRELMMNNGMCGSACLMNLNLIFDRNSDICSYDLAAQEVIVPTIKDLYSFISGNMLKWDNISTVSFVAHNPEDEALAIQGYQLMAFMQFHLLARRRLSNKMACYNSEIAKETEPHVRECVQELTRMNTGGKYIRGTLSNLGYHLFASEDVSYSDALALAFELFQTAILVHDDIIDHASFRRNQETIPLSYCSRWKTKGRQIKDVELLDVANSLAICAGDYGMYLANQKLLSSYEGDRNLGKLLSYFNHAILKTIKGEIIDVVLPFEEKYQLSENEDIFDSVAEIYRLKTAWYTLIGPLCAGAILAGCQEEELHELEKFAEEIGIAFQIKDDILGVFADTETLGKNVGSDISEFKQTILYAHIRTFGDYYEQLRNYYGRIINREDLIAVQEIFSASGALQFAEEKMDNHFLVAKKILDNITSIPDQKKDILYGLLIYMKYRHK